MAASYIGVASSQYGVPFDIEGLCKGHFDKDLCANNLYFKKTCTIFSDKENALKFTSRRAVTNNSAYVALLSCSTEEVEAKMNIAGLSKLIIEVTNAVTGQTYNLSQLGENTKILAEKEGFTLLSLKVQSVRNAELRSFIIGLPDDRAHMLLQRIEPITVLDFEKEEIIRSFGSNEEISLEAMYSAIVFFTIILLPIKK